MNKEFLNTPLGSFLKVFVIAVLVQFMNEGSDIFSLDKASIQGLINAGIVAVIPVIINALNPTDTRYGRGKTKTTEE